MSKTDGSYSGDGASGKIGEVSYPELFSLLAGGKRTIIASTLLIFPFVAVYTFLATPVYESTAVMMIGSKEGKGSQGVLDLTGYVTADKITNELENLMSNSLAEGVATALVKNKHLEKGDTSVAPILLRTSEVTNPDSLASIPVIARRLQLTTEFEPVKESDIIKILARSSDPREAALIANTYAEVYVERNLALNRSKSRYVREFLQSQLSAKQQVLDTAETSLRTYMQNSGVVSLDSETKKKVEQLATLEATRDALDVDIKTRTQTLSSYKAELAVQEPTVAQAMGESNDAYIRMLQEQLARLEVQRDVVLSQNPGVPAQEASSMMLKDSEMLKGIESQIDALREKLQARTKSYLTTLTPNERPGIDQGMAGFLAQMKQKIIEQQIELDGLRARRTALGAVLNEYEREFNQLPARTIDLAKLQRSQLSSEKLYMLLEEKFNEAAITEKSEFGTVTIVDPAVVRWEPVSPKVLRNLVLGLILGLGLGVGIVLIRPALSVKVRVPEDVKRAGLATLAVITRMEFTGSAAARKARRRSLNGEFDMHLVAHTHSFSPLVEPYRHLYANLLYAQVDRPLRSLLVTSVKQGEGKSNTVSNLAIVAAEAEKRVLLIDADLRRPTIHAIFGKPKKPGLMDVLAGSVSAIETIHARVLPNLDILCSGPMPPNPSAVLSSARMADFLRGVMDDYDVVLVDAPPLFAVTEPFVLAALVEGVVLVASAGMTTIPDLEQAAEALGEMRGKLYGVVLNNFDVRKTYRGQYGPYGYGKYGASYAYHQESKRESK